MDEIGNEGWCRRHAKVAGLWTPDDYRNQFERDRDRILYSTAYRRLAGVTQVATVQEIRLLHNRLTHSEKVGQIARRITQKLERQKKNIAKDIGLDADVAEAAGLAHDLGHPPFGHVAEEVLSNKLKDHGLGNFEGNAQTFRIVTLLAVMKRDRPGLDLTRRTLNAILKYPLGQPEPGEERQKPDPWSNRSLGGKWGYFKTESDYFQWAHGEQSTGVRSPEAIIMDWADDISFATHDISDYFDAGLIPLHNLKEDESRISARIYQRLVKKYGNSFSSERFSDAFSKLIKFPFGAASTNRRVDAAEMSAWTSAMIQELEGAVELNAQAPYVSVDADAQYMAEALKGLTWYYVIDHPSLAMAEEGQKRVISKLFDILFGWLAHDREAPRIPVALRELLILCEKRHATSDKEIKGDPVARAVCDYLCSLTERQVIDLSERLSGMSDRSIFGAWF